MESRGRINEYWRTSESIFTITMACGTTPYILTVDGRHYGSARYKLRSSSIIVTHAWVRPTREWFEAHPEHQDHVLNGGLILVPLGESSVPNDRARPGMSFEEFQREVSLPLYGRRLDPLQVPGNEGDHADVIIDIKE